MILPLYSKRVENLEVKPLNKIKERMQNMIHIAPILQKLYIRTNNLNRNNKQENQKRK